MAKMIQIRNVPDAIHRRLKAQAALEGLSLSDLLLQELRRLAERPSRSELLERLSRRRRSPLSPSPAELLAEQRAAR
jgi:hypothetical protein